MTADGYDRTIALLEAFYHDPVLPAAQVGLQRIAYLLSRLGNPERQFRSVHVAGSSGKGSTTTMIGSILEAAQFRTGYFRSPHLVDYTERISVGSTDIDRDAWVAVFDQVWPIVDDMRTAAAPDYNLGRPTLSEVMFAMAALYFAEQGVEWAAVETGLGGRLDATNVVQPDAAVVTNISLEHTRILGDTLAAIAAEKAAIIKPGSSAITGCREPEALAVVEARAAEIGVPLLRLGAEIQVEVKETSLRDQRLRLSVDEPITVRLPLAGRFQAANAALAYGVAVALRRRGVALSDDAVRRGLEGVRVPGRLEIVGERPLAILDGAHHPAAVAELVGALQQDGSGHRTIAVFTAMSDKNTKAMARLLAEVANTVIVTLAPGTDRAAPLDRLAADFSDLTTTVIALADPWEAWEYACSLAGEDDLVLATGSMYLVGYLRHAILRETATR